MSLEHSPARHGAVAPLAFTVDQFCDLHNISRSKLYEMWREGAGPRFFHVGAHRRISAEAAAAWRAEREAEASGEAA